MPIDGQRVNPRVHARLVPQGPVLTLRLATQADCRYFLLMRNDPAMIWAAGGRAVSIAEHRRWWSETRGLRCVAMLGTEAIGLVRVNPEGELAFQVAPGYQGRGYGTALLRLVLPLAQRAGFHRLTARVRVENVASRRTFARAGWQMRKADGTEWEARLECRPLDGASR